ncbi:probable membrane-associated kinase regulator 4 [Cornus florida]|uniref:probable membrane-associated kinase regulator 4 n=1 Tax=Cornus florida TaxID=4283 RepID=UPI00289A8326|nr:probable membrane-associated kinase regulator 4 [Cornus florida]
MATDHLPPCYHADEDYIDMEVSSSSNFFFDSTNSPPQTREFEFQMSLNSHEKESTTSPADELFYKGKLLPLHLPPRLQMVQKLLQNSTTTTTTFDNTKETLGDDQFYSIAFITTSTTSSTNTSTPLESCNISPSESRRVSSEINPDEYFFEWSTELTDFIGDRPKKFISWSKKLKMIKQSSLRQKLKASRAYLKSLFNKSACSDESSAKEACNFEAGYVSKGKEYLNKYKKVAKKNPFGQIGKGTYPTLANVLNSIEKEAVEDGVNSHRRSFSGAIKRHSATKSSSSSSSGASSSSSSFSFNSNGFNESQFLKRSSSANSEIDCSIEGAIAHCKQSQQLFSSRKLVGEMELCSLSASRIAASGDKERPGFYSI